MLDGKTTRHAFRKLTSASEMACVSCVLACFLQRESFGTEGLFCSSLFRFKT